MKKKVSICLLLIIIVLVYLHWSYARIYNRNESQLTKISWPQQISFPNPTFQNTVKYISLGDSLSTGVGSDDIKNTLPYIFAQKLSKNVSVSLINLAKGGATSNDLITYQLDNAIKLQPNYVTLFIGTNDIHSNNSEQNFQKNIDLILTRLIHETGAKIVVFNLPYLSQDNLILPPYNIYFDYQIQRFNQIINNLCLQYHLSLIDLYTPTKNTFSSNQIFYSKDKFHPQGEGYKLWGQLLDKQKL